MQHIIKTITIAICCLCSVFSLAQISPTTNKISVDVSTQPQSTSFNYDSCFAIGKKLGMTQTGLFQVWTSVETSPLTYNLTIFDIANSYYPAQNKVIDLTLAPIATNALEVPSDLTTTAFSSTVMINRFKRLLDSVKAHIPNITLSSLVIGSEHNVYLGSNTVKWNEYTVFYNAVSAYAKTIWPGLKVATELTFDGMVNQNSFAQTLNSSSDYIGVSYYPLNANFTVKPVSTIPVDFATLVGLYPSKPLCFYQYGYPSSTTCNSSDLQQAQFITQTFTTWDTYAAQIKLIDFTWLHDLSPATVAYYSTYYGISDPVFLEYLRTLGLRTWGSTGTDKLALHELQCQAKQRGYNSLNINCTNGINEAKLQTNAFQLYPNPVANQLVVLIDERDLIEVNIYNTLGSEVYKSKPIKGTKEISIDVSLLSMGLYTVGCFLENGSVHFQKLVISR
jgi:hypothetical protein